MKKYGICLLLCLIVIMLVAGAGYLAVRGRTQYEKAIPNTVYETETVEENRVVINQDSVEPVTETISPERFFLVSETGYLLVFQEGKDEEYLQTHIPITDFPEEEQGKLRNGIWFDSMMEVFFYLESYTS